MSSSILSNCQVKKVIVITTMMKWVSKRNPNIQSIWRQNLLLKTMFDCQMFYMDVNCHDRDHHQAIDQNFPLEKKWKMLNSNKTCMHPLNQHTLRHQSKYYQYFLWWRIYSHQSMENIRMLDRMWKEMFRLCHKNDRLSSMNVTIMHRISEQRSKSI